MYYFLLTEIFRHRQAGTRETIMEPLSLQSLAEEKFWEKELGSSGKNDKKPQEAPSPRGKGDLFCE